MKVRFKKLYENAVAPTKSHKSDAGFDLTALSFKFGEDGCTCYGTGIAVDIPKGYVGLLFPRSSVSKKMQILANSVGVIDCGYHGEIMLKFKPSIGASFTGGGLFFDMENDSIYEVGERIGQLIIIPYPEIEFVEVDEFDKSERGDGGFGSTGK